MDRAIVNTVCMATHGHTEEIISLGVFWHLFAKEFGTFWEVQFVSVQATKMEQKLKNLMCVDLALNSVLWHTFHFKKQNKKDRYFYLS